MPSTNIKRWVNRVISSEVLVIGGGSAGLFAAIAAREAGRDVLLVDKGYVGRSGSSVFAAGSINICSPGDNQADWMEEIVVRGEYLNDQEWVRIQLEETYPLACRLQAWGKSCGKTVLEEDAKGDLIRRKARGNIKTMTNVINALPMMDTLRRRAVELGTRMVERVMVTHLIKQEERVVGALGLDCRSAEMLFFPARAVVLAAGGCGFKGFFIGHRNLTGEADLMAYRVGAVLRNIDQAMSNTTAREMDVHGLSLMVGCGGRFLNGLGEEFMYKYDPEVGSRARLTRLVVGMAREVEAGRGPVYMDLTGVSPNDQALLKKVVPEGFRAFARLGMDPFAQRIEWMPAFMGTLAHGGGVHIDTRCASTLPGLYVAGDASCTPEHGTWSITGLNLAFCFVSGYRSGRFAAEWAGIQEGEVEPGTEALEQIQIAAAELTAPVKRQEGVEPDSIVQALRAILFPYHVAYLRRADRLEAALARLEELKEAVSRLVARDAHGLVKAFEAICMTTVGEMVLRSVLYRQESRGFLYREDFPLTDNINWLKWVTVRREGEAMVVESQTFSTPYLEPPRQIYAPR